MTDRLFDQMVSRAKTAAESASADGIPRNAALEEHINQICRNVLQSPDGELLMQYLRTITTNRILSPAASDAELRSLEGQRALVAILDIRRHSKPKD